MADWIEHNGGPQPVADDVWVQVNDEVEGVYVDLASGVDWPAVKERRILNQHLIDAALKRGIELGLDAAADKLAEWQDRDLSEILHIDPETIAKEADNEPR